MGEFAYTQSSARLELRAPDQFRAGNCFQLHTNTHSAWLMSKQQSRFEILEAALGLELQMLHSMRRLQKAPNAKVSGSSSKSRLWLACTVADFASCCCWCHTEHNSMALEAFRVCTVQACRALKQRNSSREQSSLVQQ